MELNKIYFEDCLETMKRIPDGSIDLLLQDTPFGVTQNEWDIRPDFKTMWPEWNRTTKQNGAMLFFATQPFASELILGNIKNFRYDLVWYKPLASGFLNAQRMPLRNHEIILVFYRKLPTYNPQMGVGIRKKGKNSNTRKNNNYNEINPNNPFYNYDDNGTRHPQSVIEYSNGDRTHESDHPTQKPVNLIRYLIKTYSNEGDTVFDGYMGSGTTAIACIEEKRNFIGSENNKEYFDLSEKRIKTYLMQQVMNFV